MDNQDTAFMKRAWQRYALPKEEWTTIDHMIYDYKDYLDKDYEAIAAQRDKAIKESLIYHYNNNRFYKEYCKEYDFHPDSVVTEKDYENVPMLPDTFFKDYPSEDPKAVFDWLQKISTSTLKDYTYKGKDLQGFLRWAEEQSGGLINHSSGTTGNYGIMFRDKTTFHRFYYGILNSAAQTTTIKKEPHYVSASSPNTYLTIGRWAAEVGNVFLAENRYFLSDREITMRISRLIATGDARGLKDKLILKALHKAMTSGEKRLIEVLKKLSDNKEQVLVFSTPYQLYSIMHRMKQQDISLDFSDTGTVVMTGGGWKIFEHKKIPFSEFSSMVQECFGVPEELYVDLYGMSEMNGLALSCSGGYKHLVPWIYPMVLDEEQGRLGYGEWGRFAFLDPVAHSYPGYIITGDRVRMLEKCPHCGRPGPVLDGDISRLQGAEAKGCANLMRGMMAEEFKKMESRRK